MPLGFLAEAECPCHFLPTLAGVPTDLVSGVGSALLARPAGVPTTSRRPPALFVVESMRKSEKGRESSPRVDIRNPRS